MNKAKAISDKLLELNLKNNMEVTWKNGKKQEETGKYGETGRTKNTEKWKKLEDTEKNGKKREETKRNGKKREEPGKNFK